MPHTILILAANPKDTQSLRVSEELRDILANLRDAKYAEHLQARTVLATRPDDAGRAMLKYKPRIVHFAGHGEGADGIVLENDAGETQLASTQALQRLFRTFAEHVDCVVLNACYSQVQAEAIAEHIPVVAGMRRAVSDETSVAFASAFYQAIGNGETYRKAYDYALSIVELKALDSDIPQLNLRDGAEELSLLRADMPAGLPLAEDNPYLGLQAFQETDADRFFGRCDLTLQVFETLETVRNEDLKSPYPENAKARFLAILGPSGSGKSSLVRAGLAPVLKAEWNARVLTLLPGDKPLESLARALAEFDPQGATVSKAKKEYLELLKEADGLRSIVSDLLARRPQPLVLLIDQFEETFSLCRDRVEQQAFIAALLTAAQAPHTHLWAVLTLRSDFLGETQSYPTLNRLIARQSVIVPIMQPKELRQAIERPALALGHPLDAPAVALLLEQSAGRQGALPLLQFALLRIWQGMTQGVPPADTLEQTGGVGGALAQTAEALFKSLSEAEQQIARRVFLKLVQLGEGSRDTRRRAALAEMVAHGEDAETVQTVLNRFARQDARLISLSGENVIREGHGESEEQNLREPRALRGQNVFIEFSHEALLEHWTRLNEWLDAGRDDLRFERRLNDAIRQWDENRQASGFLWSAPEQMGLLLEYRAKHGEEMTAGQVAFFEASRTEQKRRQRNKRLTLLTIMALLVGVALGGWFYAQEQAEAKKEQERLTGQALEAEKKTIATAKQVRAVEKKAKTNEQNTLRTQSLFLVDLARQQIEQENAVNSMLLALEALPNDMNNPDRPYVIQAEEKLYGAVYAQRERIVLPHSRVIAFSSDGTQLVMASDGWTARLWDVQSGRVLHTLSGYESAIRHAAFSPDGTQLVTASDDKTVRLWDVQSGRVLRIRTLSRHKNYINHAAFSPDGTLLATASDDKTVRLWDVQSGRLLHTLRGHGYSIYLATFTFSPDGTLLAIAPDDKTARLWDVQSGRILHIFSGHENSVNHAAFSPDGTQLVTASGDDTARLWDLQTKRLLHTLRGHYSGVKHAAFNPDGTRLITASYDNTARLWDVQSGQLLHTFSGHKNYVNHAAFSPDGTLLATASDDNTVRLWDVQSGRLLHTLRGHEDSVYHAAFSPDGTRVVTASSDKTVRFWDVQSMWDIHTLSGHNNDVNHVAFSPDGTQLVTASDDNTARLWDVQSKRVLHTLRGHEERVKHAAFSPDGTQLVTTSDEEIIARLWDVQSGRILHTFGGDGYWVNQAVFSPNGTLLVTTSEYTAARLWDVQSGRGLHTLSGHEGDVNAAFSPDGTLLVTTSGYKTVRLWDVQSGRVLHSLNGHEARVNQAAFSPDGTQLVTASDDKTARLWDVQSGRVLHALSGHEDWVIRAAFSSDGTQLVTASNDNTARLWDVQSGQVRHTLSGHDVNHAAFSPDGTLLVTASDDNTARLWDVQSGQVRHTLSGHKNSVYHAAFSPDGTRVVTASRDNAARLWRIFPTTQELIDYANAQLPRRLTVRQRERFFLPEDEKLYVAETLLAQGEQQAREGLLEDAIASFRQAQKNNPALNFDPEVKARVLAANGLLGKGTQFAKAGKLEQAIAAFSQVKTLRSGNFLFDPETKARKLYAPKVIKKGEELAWEGKLAEALAHYAKARQLDRDLQISADSWNTLCRFGGIYQKAAPVLPACEKAAELAPDNHEIRDSRGLVRALTGDTQGAITDFQFFVEKTDGEEDKAQLQEWIKALQKGKNPFTPELLEQLKGQ
ncbi:MAG: CHAT domain-containing protein [Gammaproteobacteria bacterium]|nr:CHAT domain-containing protein [Gammaproteobacteria bacterium]